MTNTKLSRWQQKAERMCVGKLHVFPRYGWQKDGPYSVTKCMKCGRILRVEIVSGQVSGDAVEENCA